MRRKLSPFKLGVFVLTGTAIVIGGLLWIGAARMFQRTRTYVTYFDLSVKGLSSGSSVEHLGVKVGEVSSISLFASGSLVRVVMAIDRSFTVKKTQAVEMKLTGITGGHYLAIVRAPANLEQLTPKISFRTKYPLIPSVPGTVTQIEDELGAALKKFQQIDFQGLIASFENLSRSAQSILANDKIRQTLENIDQASTALKTLLSGVSTPATIQEISKGLADFAAAASSVRTAGDLLAAQVKAIPPDSFAALAGKMDKTASDAERLMGTIGPQIDASLNLFQQSLDQLNRALSEVRGLAQKLREEPGQILERPRGSQPFGR